MLSLFLGFAERGYKLAKNCFAHVQLETVESRLTHLLVGILWVGICSCLATKPSEFKTTRNLFGCFFCHCSDQEMLFVMKKN